MSAARSSNEVLLKLTRIEDFMQRIMDVLVVQGERLDEIMESIDELEVDDDDEDDSFIDDGEEEEDEDEEDEAEEEAVEELKVREEEDEMATPPKRERDEQPAEGRRMRPKKNLAM
jgi:hypothetical protein